MARINLGDGRWFDSAKAEHFEEETTWDGRNHISVATGSQWEHERLYRTAKGVWIINHWSQWQGSTESYDIVSNEQAYDWLIANKESQAVPAEYLAKKEV